MKNYVKGIVSAGIVFMAMTGSVSASTVTGNATAEIIDDISVTETEVLNFGTIISPSSADLGSEPGTVEVYYQDESNPELQNCDLVTCLGDTSSYSLGKFQFTYSTQGNYSVTLPTVSSVVVHTNDSDQMTVTGFTAAILGTTTSEDGSETTVDYGIGALLEVQANQLAGVYSGTYELTVSYS